MFKRRRRRGTPITKVIGGIIFLVGAGTLLYIMPFTIWIAVFAFACIGIGVLIFHM
ncbi:MAG: hypothetical protein JJT76_16290 [Clostridiaceae bacterium]|nr:hypothetical protein [Clostridiaceae bacterium]